MNLTKEQIQQCREVLEALTIDASTGESHEIKLKQPEWANRVNALCDLDLTCVEITNDQIAQADYSS